VNAIINEAIDKARESGINFQGWSYKEIAAAIKLTTKTEHTVKDIAEELVAMTAHGEISFV
jgi:predicted DNA-binding ArsR family transcriptional regulator